MTNDDLSRVDLIAFALERSGVARIVLTGDSMRPLVRGGTVAEVRPLLGPPPAGAILVFRAGRKLVAHRLMATLASGAYVTCGDAHPERCEVVEPSQVLGVVSALWSSGDADARRLDGPWLTLFGRALVAARGARAAASFAASRTGMLFAGLSHVREEAAFSALVRATLAFEAGRTFEGVAAFTAARPDALVATIRRHHASGLAHAWLAQAEAAGVRGLPEVREALARTRFANALQARRVVARVSDVVGALRGAGIEPVVLKGGARLAMAEGGADLQFSGDVDALVPAALGERAVATLHAAGYRDTASADRVAHFAARHHHYAPLAKPGEPIPVEIHVALATPGSVSQPWTYEDLVAHTVATEGPAGRARVLDAVYSAVHLAYHARDFHVWRDVVLLARRLRAFRWDERVTFEAAIAGERRDAVRLRAAVACADAINGVKKPPAARVRRYVAWAIAREQLSDALRRRAHAVDHLIGCRPRRFAGVREALRKLRGWSFDALAAPFVSVAAARDGTARHATRALFDPPIR